MDRRARHSQLLRLGEPDRLGQASGDGGGQHGGGILGEEVDESNACSAAGRRRPAD